MNNEIVYPSRELYTIEELREVYELNLKDLKQGADKDIKRRAKKQNLATHYQGVTSGGIIEYETKSITTESKEYWEQQVKMLDLDEAINSTKADDLSDREIVDLALSGDIAVYCSCPSFKWHGYQYIAWQMDYGLKKQTHPPDTRNPDRKGTVCKHLYNVFTVMPAHLNRIVSDLRDKGLI